MPVQGCIPFDPATGYVTSLNGLVLGAEYFDPSTGFWYKLVQLYTDLAGDALADKQALTYQAKNVVTNKTSTATNTTTPVAAGVACGTFAESTSSVTKYILILVQGEKLVLTDAGDDIALDDNVVYDDATDGKVDRLAKASDTITSTAVLDSILGRALAADVDASDWVLVRVNCRGR